ncbi:DUF4172 domain-containing protein [Psychromonas sp.]
MWIWNNKGWSNFSWNSELINPLLRKVQLNQDVSFVGLKLKS